MISKTKTGRGNSAPSYSFIMEKKMIQTYAKWLLNIFIVAFSLGYFLPMMISAQSTFAVMLGILYLVVIVPAALYLINVKVFVNKNTENVK